MSTSIVDRQSVHPSFILLSFEHAQYFFPTKYMFIYYVVYLTHWFPILSFVTHVLIGFVATVFKIKSNNHLELALGLHPRMVALAQQGE